MKVLTIIFFIAAIAEPSGYDYSITAWLLRFAVCMALAVTCAAIDESNRQKRRRAKRAKEKRAAIAGAR